MAANADLGRPLLAAGALSRLEARSRIEAQLAPLLWRMKFGGDATRETARAAVGLFGAWISDAPSWKNGPGAARPQLLYPFAARVIGECLHDRCEPCGGTGLQELLRNGMRRRTRRFGNPNIQHVVCRACGGARRAGPDSKGRAEALGISVTECREQWTARFSWATARLACIAHRLHRPLRMELERRI